MREIKYELYSLGYGLILVILYFKMNRNIFDETNHERRVKTRKNKKN